MSVDRREVGKRAEDAAAAFLKKKGMRILARNLRLQRGEIDCIALERDVLVFVEVKAATGDENQYPEEHVTEAKQRQLVKLALAYMRLHRLEDKDVRFDVVAVVFGKEGKPDIHHFPDAFDAAGRFGPYDH
ncbi:MAG: YraN family protein [Planctomycetota bacterium]